MEVAALDTSLVKRKRGRPARSAASSNCKPDAAPPPKRCMEEEDVCFICFDGGNLVLCDHRDCPKAYHPACVKRDESFFTPRIRWNCGWHLCNNCKKNALFMCYTCPYSLCKACVKQADISCVRGNKGFCRTCMNTIMLIENVTQGNKEVGNVDFDDTTSWEYLFKVYWVCLKQKESLTLVELSQATNPWKSLVLNHRVNPSPKEHHNTCASKIVEMGSTTVQLGVNNSPSKRRKTRKQLPQQNNSRGKIVTDKLQDRVVDWASKELLEFIAHMKNGYSSSLSQFDVQALLLEYIRKNNLRDPQRKCQVICDKRLMSLFGKARVGHFEMLKLLEYHFKDDSCASGVVNAGATDSAATWVEIEQCSKDAHTSTSERKRQARKKLDWGGRQTSLDDYAAINSHNINLIYLRRSLMEKLLEDVQKFHDIVVGSVVRIRISDNDLKQELYRLVRVVGASKAAEPYKVGDMTTRIKLKILNLGRIEDIMVDAISNQDFSEDECRRFRQIIKCGLVERMTVGKVQDIAIALRGFKVKEVLEAEISKLNHLRDRASEMGHWKQLRDCVEQLELLKSPEERQRRIHDIAEVHADPRMDPSYQSDEDSEQSDTTKQDLNMTRKYSGSNLSIELISPRRGDMSYNTRIKVLRSCSSNWEQRRNLSSTSHLYKGDDAARSHESSQSSFELETDAARILEELRNRVDPCQAMASVSHPQVADDSSMTSSSSASTLSSDDTELEETWHYQDPSGKVQGPFCMLQLRRWNSNGYFPTDLRVWRTNESLNRSVLLTNALSKQCHSEHEVPSNTYLESQEARFITDGKNINTNSLWTNVKPNEGCDSELTDASACVDESKQLNSVLNSVQEPDLASSSELPCNENQKRPFVPSSAGLEVHDASPVSSDTSVATMDHNLKPECSDLPSSTSKADSEDSECRAVETGQWLSALNSTSQVSGSNLSLTCGSPKFPDLPSLTTNSEPAHEGLNWQASENKVETNFEVEAEENKCPFTVCNVATDQNELLDVPSCGEPKFPDLSSPTLKSEPGHEGLVGQASENKVETNFEVEAEGNKCPFTNCDAAIDENELSDLPGRTPAPENEGAKSLITEIKQSCTSHKPGKDSDSSLNNLSSGIDFSTPLSSANRDDKGIKVTTAELFVTSNIACQGTEMSWNTATSLAGSLLQSVEQSMKGKSCVQELDSGIASVASVDLDDAACEHATTTPASCQFTNSSIHPDWNTCSWYDGPIELCTLGDESVSDLLSEVEALESLHGMSSPTLRMNFRDDLIDSSIDDCFSPLMGYAWSSNLNIQFHSQPMTGEFDAQFAVNPQDCATNPPDPHSSIPDFASAQ